jgi:4'-phosphopantetheinyl transferase
MTTGHKGHGTRNLSTVEVYAIQLLPAEDFELVRGKMLEILPQKARERFTHLSRGADVQRSLLGELLARYLIAGKLRISGEEIIFEAGPNGKPAIRGNDTLYFNISHSGQWVVCAIASVPVGVDVERLRPVNPGLAKRFFTNGEFEMLQALPEEERTSKFIELWTLKESFLKAIGRGLTRNLNSFSVEPNNGLFVITGDDSSGKYFLKLLAVDSAYRLAVCAPSGDFCESVVMIEINEILKN